LSTVLSDLFRQDLERNCQILRESECQFGPLTVTDDIVVFRSCLPVVCCFVESITRTT